MKWLAVLAQAIERIPLERLLFKPPSNKKSLEDLQEILSESHVKPTEAAPEEPIKETHEEAEAGYLEPRRQKVHLPEPRSELSTEETVEYQNREIAKNLLALERHYAQRLRINGIPCDCGSGRHLLAIETLAEEAIPMVDNPNVYYRIIDWVKEVGPKSTDEAAKSGKYDNEYPPFSHQARDFRKEIIGSLEPSALFPQKETSAEILPVASEEKVAEV